MLVITGSVGAGHDGVAAELARRLEADGVRTETRDFLAALPRYQRAVLRDGYALSATHVPAVFDWFFRCGEHDSLARRLTLRVCRAARPAVARWVDEGYDAVVTTFPFAAQTLGSLKEDGSLLAPTVCYLTDPAPHRLWVHPALDAHLTVTEATAAEGTARYGVPMEVAGPLVPTAVGRPLDPAERRRVRAELGIGDDRTMALMVTGSLGMGDIVASVEAVRAAPRTVPVVLCGRNERVLRQVAALSGAVALGWRDDVPQLLSAADVLVHNAGGLSLTEALVAGLPAVSYEVIAGHGSANAATLAASGLAPWPRSPAELADALAAQAARGRVQLPPLPSGHDAASRVAGLARRAHASGAHCDPAFGRISASQLGGRSTQTQQVPQQATVTAV
ncbi:glycosyltransferase [Streptacidiphilus sp. MAP12-20]|uniref:MGDG synthase family glycosyltransferase n=1 Tax=Streptacidiphilus sp. MAP12-20 TaxID=3156299 RepID=UPI0035167AF6